jgi:hypothetical protein
MFGCLAIMAVMMPLGMRVARRVRRATAKHAPDSSISGAQDASSPADDADARDPERNAGGRRGA